ncbi:ketoacyl-ACP synthase III family protein [Streptomyces sp. H27-D2]|uniref:ketoacyl-ACP synthase III family protein n=1 Tax=Streptomyces sp. H27-D2 TaxID=3046304 RepID=UPI002DBE91C6|nr:ketoacyl-ACP synthase III family protein [Streptomyces sp. H27-D2]MEC4015469.1 ketoacyl-ACP synthase III family protein [Streptomyces sp. H27-D2]
MRWDNLYLAGIGTYLPEQVETVDEAIAAGRYTAEKKAMNGYRSVRVAAPGETGPTMAVHAARQAVARSGLATEDFGLLVHSYIGHQGLDVWTPASYVQRETIGGAAPSFEVKQGCNGFMAGLEAAASHITARPEAPAALVTGGDAFRMPFLDRWASHEQNVDGDGAGALVLSSRGGFARVRATCSIGDPSLEPLGRHNEWTDTPFPDGRTLSLDTSLRDYMQNEEADLDEVVERISNGVQQSLKQVLHEAGADLSDIRFFLHQQLAETIAVHGLYNLLGVDRASTTFDWGKDLGMVGTVDLVLALDHVIATRNPQPGDLAVLQGAGAGYVWTTAVIEFLETPAWAGN